MSDSSDKEELENGSTNEDSVESDEVHDDFFKCEVCQTGFTDKEDFDDHIQERHHDQPAEVREEYGNRFDSVLDEPESPADNDTADIDEEQYEATTVDGSVGNESQSISSQSPKIEEGTAGEDEEANQATMGNKWYIAGVGGAGGRIVDSILLRKNSLEDTSKPLAGVWQQALTGHTILNTNHNDITNTFYYEELNSGWTENELLNGSTIGIDHPDNDYTGCGQNWTLAKEFIRHDFADGDNPIENPSSGYKIEKDRISQSQAVMVTNSVAGGTGCGAAPILAKEIKKLDVRKNKKIFGSLVLPAEEEEGEDDMANMVNGCAGTARMAKYVDAVLIFENGNLESANSELEDTEGLEIYKQYEEKNNAILKYFEIFSMASIDDAEILGDDFDINDALEPINLLRPRNKDYYEDDPEDENHPFPEPGNILAPVIARSRATEMTAQSIEMLAERALNQNKLADFDPSTAWGGTFVFFGPEEKLDSNVIYGKFDDLVQNEYLEKPDGYSYVSTNNYIITVSDLDSVYLWGFLWNPKMESINRMYDAAEHVKGDGNRLAEGLDGIWDTVEGLQKLMGRDNMG